MQDPEHANIVRRGRIAISEWRARQRFLGKLDVSGADLRYADLHGADLQSARLVGTDLRNAFLGVATLNAADMSCADLRDANLQFAKLICSDLRDANICAADLGGTDLTGANLSGADLRGANLTFANLQYANLDGAYLQGAYLQDAKLFGTSLCGADLMEVSFDGTLFIAIDLSKAKNLEYAIHLGPSYLSTDTLLQSKGEISDVFLRGCGLQAWEVTQAKLHAPELTTSEIEHLQYDIFDKRTKGAYFGGVFISYSRKDDHFVDRIYDRLKKEGIPVWLDRHDVLAGDLQRQIAKAIRLNDVILLVLSEESIRSDWVESELDIARKREKAENRDLLCPISIDDAWKSKLDDDASDRALWLSLTKKAIIDFSPAADFETSFGKLLRGLKINYPK